MRKYLFLIATAITLGFTSCSEEECDHFPSGGVEDRLNIVGSWYEEVYNEEVHYYESGKFYDRFSNILRCSEVEGAYEYNHKNKKLTYRSIFSGDNKVADYKVSDLSELGFTISSDIGKFYLEKIVETYNLEVGESTPILFESEYPSYSVLSYSSNNERLASVTSNGIITAEGEKGATYIKVSTAQGNVWVKVVVGDDCADLWFDYVSVIGMSYDEMRAALSRLGEPYNEGQDYAFGFIHSVHDIVDIVKVYLAPSTGLVSEIQILFKDGVPEAEVLSYMNSHYYKFAETENCIFYSTLSDKESSKAIVSYDKIKRTVFLFETQSFLNPPVVDLWTDFIPLFGMNKTSVKAKMEEFEYPFLMSDDSYSANGSDYYSIIDNEYANMVGFVFNSDNVVSEYWVYMNINSDTNAAYNYLSKKYQENKSESTATSLVFYGENETLRVVFDLDNATITYTNLALRQHETPKDEWVDYSEGLGMTNEQIIEKFGIPYSNEKDVTYYWIGSSCVNLCAFNYDSTTNKCNKVILTLNEDLSESDVIELMTSKYVVFANGTMEDGSQYAWTNGASVKESTMGIIYVPKDRMLIYQSLN